MPVLNGKVGTSIDENVANRHESGDRERNVEHLKRSIELGLTLRGRHSGLMCVG